MNFSPLMTAVFVLLASAFLYVNGELLQNGAFESLTGWVCGGFTCTLNDTARRSGQYGVSVTGRTQNWMGPGHFLTLTCGQPSYQASGYVRLLSNQGGQTVKLTVDFKFTNNSHKYVTVDRRNNVQSTDGWIHLSGTFTRPYEPVATVKIYFGGPTPGVDFAVDDASVVAETCQCDVPLTSEQVIEQIRKSDINIGVTTGQTINKDEVKIHVRLVRGSFPLGTAVRATTCNENAGGGRYRDIIHQYFKWAVIENALKWRQIEWNRGQTNYQRALDTVNGLRSHGVQVRGHTLVWSVEDKIQNWVKELAGQELRDVVQHHMQETINMTKGLLEHWDVNNENLHGRWFQDRLQDPSYNLEFFRIAHHYDPSVKLFLNDYNVVASGSSTDDYLQQAQEVKAAYVGLYGLWAQCHFGDEVAPDPVLIKQRLDTLAQAGLPIWVTELDVQAQDEGRRAEFYETALRALYGHPAVEGILFWGFWDQAHWRGEKAALVKGDNLEPTAAGLRVIDLFSNEWSTNVTHVLSQSGDQFTVRGFHGDYEVRVYHQGLELESQRSTFTLSKESQSVSFTVQ